MNERRTPFPRRARPCWLALVATLACSPPDARPQLPRGPLIAGDARALERLLDSFEQLEATPLAREARQARSAVANCDEFETSRDRVEARLFEGDVCLGEPLAPGLLELRGDAPLVFVWPLGEGPGSAEVDRAGSEPRLMGRIRLDEAGSVRIEARVEPLPDAGWARMLIPAQEPPGPPRLAGRDALVQARLRPRDGLDLAALVASGSQADAMFRLRSELFVGAALGEVWELAIYLPRPGREMPPMALALDVASPTLAESGVRSFVRELEATWPVRAREAQWRSEAVVSGACFYGLRILPDFAPCYAMTQKLLVFGWNSESVELALAEGPAAENRSGRSGLIAHLDRFEEADARLQSAARARHGAPLAATSAETTLASLSSDAARVRYPFSKLEIEAVAVQASVELRVHLRSTEMQ